GWSVSGATRTLMIGSISSVRCHELTLVQPSLLFHLQSLVIVFQAKRTAISTARTDPARSRFSCNADGTWRQGGHASDHQCQSRTLQQPGDLRRRERRDRGWALAVVREIQIAAALAIGFATACRSVLRMSVWAIHLALAR